MGRRLGGGAVIIAILAVVVLVAGLYGVAYAFAADRIPRGTTVADVAVGGLAPAAARDKLDEALGDRDAVELTVAGKREKLTAEQLGFALDLDATVEAAGGGRSWDPRRLWDYYAGGDEIEPVVDVDDATFETAVAALEKEHGRPPREGAVRFPGGKVTTVKARSGLGLDRDATLQALRTAFVTGEPATLPLTDTQPEISDEDVAEAVKAFAEPAVSGPVTLVFEGARVKLAPAEFAPALGMKAEDGALVPHLDRTKLDEVLDSRLGEHGTAVDATVELVNGVPKVIPGKPGVSFDPQQVSEAFLDVVVQPAGERTLPVKSKVAKPDVTTAEARKWGIKEKVSTFTTYYPHTDYRNVNIPRALELIDGTVLAPGETFSMNETVGQRTEANGFVAGYVIDGGQITTALGGGVSQVATTSYNAAFFAGLEDVEHKAHSLYFSRYPIGREATVAWPYVDLKFKNTTPYGVLIDTSYVRSTPSSSGVVTVSIWSTKYWDITTTTGERRNIVTPGERTSTDPDCEPQDPNTGFDITVYRHFNRNGERVRTETIHTHYNSADKVICRAPEEKPAQ